VDAHVLEGAEEHGVDSHLEHAEERDGDEVSTGDNDEQRHPVVVQIGREILGVGRCYVQALAEEEKAQNTHAGGDKQAAYEQHEARD